MDRVIGSKVYTSTFYLVLTKKTKVALVSVIYPVTTATTCPKAKENYSWKPQWL